MRYKLSEIAAQIGGSLSGDGDMEITGVAPIETAEKGDITFLANPKYAKYLHETQASAVVVPEGVSEIGGKALIFSKNSYYAFLQVVLMFHPEKVLIDKGIHDTARIGEDSKLGEDVSIGAYVVVGKGCRIGKGSVLLPGVVVYDDVVIGEECLIHSNVSIREGVRIGNRVVLHNGTVVGSDGFGFAPQEGVYHKIPQIGTVIIEDDVEIGANCTIDRATLGETRIKKGAKLDNLIQVGHNCTIGENTVIAGQTGLSGSTHIGKNVRVGGQVGFAGHMKVGDGAAIGAQSGVNKSVPPGVTFFGYPAKLMMEEFRIQGALKHLPDCLKDVKRIKQKLEELEQKKGK